MVASEEEITHGIEEDDAVRTARRAAAATRVGELARRRTAIAEQLSDVERELGDVLAESSDVIEIDELARYTKVKASDLARWLNERKPARTKRKRSSLDLSRGKGLSSSLPSRPATAQSVSADSSADVA